MLNRFSLWKSLRRERKHLPACGSRIVLCHWLFLSCQSLYLHSTKLRHSTRGSKCADLRCSYGIFRQQRNKGYFDFGRTRRTGAQNQSKSAFSPWSKLRVIIWSMLRFRTTLHIPFANVFPSFELLLHKCPSYAHFQRINGKYILNLIWGNKSKTKKSIPYILITRKP